MSQVAVSFEQPECTADVDGLGTLRLLEAIRILGLEKKTRSYQAGTSELYGLAEQSPGARQGSCRSRRVTPVRYIGAACCVL